MIYDVETPINYSIENTILGACISEPSAMGRVYDLLKPEYFQYEENKLLYTTLAEMYADYYPIDLITVMSRLKTKVQDVNGSTIPYFLSTKIGAVTSTANLEVHCLILREAFIRAQLQSLILSGVGQGDTLTELQTLLNRLQTLQEGMEVKEWQNIRELLVGLAKHQDKMTASKGQGIKTFINEIDRNTGGFFGGNFVIIGARPGVGKSALMGQMALDQAKSGKKVGIISLEMNNSEVTARLSSLHTSTDFNTIFRSLYRDEEERVNFYEKVNEIENLPLWVSDNTKVNANQIRAKVLKLKNQQGLDIVFIDYLQLVNADHSKNGTRENEVSQISRGLKLMAKDLDIPVVVLAQLNRNITQRSNGHRYPQLSDLRESGSLEQDADAVIFLHKDWDAGIPTNEDGSSTQFQADLIVRKWRNGPSNYTVPLDFIPSQMRFKERNTLIKLIKVEQDEMPF